MQNKKSKRQVAGLHNQPGLDQPGQSPNIKDPVYLPNDEKIEVDIRETIRVRPNDFWSAKQSFEEWLQLWDR